MLPYNEVYTVSCNSYKDGGVLGVFSTLYLAEAFVAKLTEFGKYRMHELEVAEFKLNSMEV